MDHLPSRKLYSSKFTCWLPSNLQRILKVCWSLRSGCQGSIGFDVLEIDRLSVERILGRFREKSGEKSNEENDIQHKN